MIIVLLSILSLIISMDINYVSQHSLIDLKSHFLTSLELYGFRLMNNETGNIILQPFQDIDYFYLCNEEYKILSPETYCTKITNLKADTDNDLGIYSKEYSSLIFLFHEELQMKLFFEESINIIDIDNDLYFKCFDFFSNHNQLTFYLDSKLNYDTTINIQFATNISTNISTNITTNVSSPNISAYSTMRLLDRNSVIRYLMFNKTEINYFYKLSSQNKYSLEYSTPVEKKIHSMLCLTFSDYEEYFFATYTHKIPIISSGYYKFYSFLEKEWNVSSEYYPTTFYFYLNETNYTYCSYIQITNNSNSREINPCILQQHDDIDYLYTLKLYSHRDSYILIALFFEAKPIDDDCHFGKYLIFNKTATEYDGAEHYAEILKEVNNIAIAFIVVILFIISSIVYYPLLHEKLEKCKIDDNKKE